MPNNQKNGVIVHFSFQGFFRKKKRKKEIGSTIAFFGS